LLWTLAGIAWMLVVSFLVLCTQWLPGQVAATAGEPKPGVFPAHERDPVQELQVR
jgi:hypothetical protein